MTEFDPPIPPAHSPSLPRPVVVPILIVINIAVFFGWYFLQTTDSTFMEENFLTSWTAVTAGHLWVLLTAVFSHNMFWHLFINMYVLKSFGSLLEIVLGWKAFLSFYLLAGITSSLVHCLVSTYLLGSPELPALGASGAISGLVLIFSFLYPRERIMMFGVIPIPALWGALAFVGLDLWGLIAQARGGGLPIGHGAHLGGALAGVVYYFLFLRARRA